MSRDCVYATAGWGIHDERWVRGLREVGLEPRVVSLGGDVHSVDELRTAVLAAAQHGPVLAGPLHTVTGELVDLPIGLVGLSWGYDLALVRTPEWLARMSGLILDSQENVAIARAAGVAAETITFLPWGVDLEEFPFLGAAVDTLQLGVPAHAPLILSLRAHEPSYRVGDIVAAFARLEGPAEAYLVVGHSGSLSEELQVQAHELGVANRVRFIGSLPEDRLAPLLTRAACYVTAAEVDGTSVTLLQAMACGTPVVASATPGNLGWIEDGVTGTTFATGDVDGLADALGRVLADRPREQAVRARDLVEREADWHANLPRLRDAMLAAGRKQVGNTAD